MDGKFSREKNCHFLSITEDDVGPNGIDVQLDKVFDDEAQWKYLKGMLEDKVDKETAERIKLAQHKLPELFKKIKMDSVIIYPFRYGCSTGEYLYPELEKKLRKNVAKGNGKARATSFAFPVLGRFPKIFFDIHFKMYTPNGSETS